MTEITLTDADRAASMAAYDSLPPSIRQKLADCPYNFDCRQIAEAYRARGEKFTLAYIEWNELVAQSRKIPLC